jgi:hypothetical protein
VLYLGLPLWWLCGLMELIVPVMAIPMAVSLLARRRVIAPRGFGLWLLFLAWMLAGATVLSAHAPGTQQGSGAPRLLPWALVTSVYFSATIIMLYVGNLTEDELPSPRVHRMLAFGFAVTAGGGVLGMVAPHLTFPSLIQLVLPGGLANSQAVRGLAGSPVTAQIQDFLGYSEARPAAPFSYTNEWGANLSLFLPFAVLAWLRRDAGWRKYLGTLVLLMAVIPAVYSLNRGLWLGLIALGTYVVVRLVAMGRLWALQAVTAVALVGAIAVFATPLAGIVQQRLAAGHSNARRSDLAGNAAVSALASPVVGFGSTRQVQGSFTSVAGGESADCPRCAPPPLGTHGHLWRLLFTNGYGGAALFLAFFGYRYSRHWRDRTPQMIAGCSVLLMAMLYLPIYNILTFPLMTCSLAVALMWRGERLATAER